MGANSRQKVSELACSVEGIIGGPDAILGSSYRLVKGRALARPSERSERFECHLLYVINDYFDDLGFDVEIFIHSSGFMYEGSISRK